MHPEGPLLSLIEPVVVSPTPMVVSTAVSPTVVLALVPSSTSVVPGMTVVVPTLVSDELGSPAVVTSGGGVLQATSTSAATASASTASRGRAQGCMGPLYCMTGHL
jgi:hypothetical protein